MVVDTTTLTVKVNKTFLKKGKIAYSHKIQKERSNFNF